MQTLNPLPAPSFASLPEPPTQWRYFSVSCVLQALILVAPIFNPIDVHDNVHLVAIEWPAPVTPEPAPMLKEAPQPRPVPQKVELQPLEQQRPTIQVPRQKVQVAEVEPPAQPATESPASPEPVNRPKLPRAIVTTNFGGMSALVTENKPARQVETGGFGDPNGVTVSPNGGRKDPTIAKVGSFDLPQGAGSGNGRGGAKGAPGTVASAGLAMASRHRAREDLAATICRELLDQLWFC